MTEPKLKIVADSSIDVRELSGANFATAPLKIITSEREYCDDAVLDVDAMVNDLFTYKGKSQTSCPNPEEWLSAFGEAEQVFCITITAKLSGSYNAAMIAKRRYEEEKPTRRVHVINSLSTGPEMLLIAEELQRLIAAGCDFDSIVKAITEYQNTTGLIFVLQSMKNLANNGRVSPLAAKFAGVLGIRAVGKASDVGDLESLEKCRGDRKTLESVLANMKKLGYAGGRVKIAHCQNPAVAEALNSMLLLEFPEANTDIYRLGGLCSFYAEKGGLIIGFEKSKTV